MKKKIDKTELIKYNEKCSTFRINVETIQRIGTSLTKTKLMKVWYAYLEYLLIGNTEVDFKNDASMVLAFETLIAEQEKKMKYFDKKYKSKPNQDQTEKETSTVKETVDAKPKKTKTTPTIEEKETPTVEESQTPKKEVLSFDELINKIERDYEQKQKATPTVVNQTKTKYDEWDEFESSFFTSTPRSLKEVAYN